MQHWDAADKSNHYDAIKFVATFLVVLAHASRMYTGTGVVIPYNASDVADPFKPAKMDVAKGKGALIPNVNRPREPLESYDLEKLQMAGTLQQGKTIQALIKAPDGTLHRVRQGSYLGRNFGMVVRIGETEVTLKEIVEDSGGDWVERTSSLTLEEVEQNAQKVGQKK